jgi:hypothetical protein
VVGKIRTVSEKRSSGYRKIEAHLSPTVLIFPTTIKFLYYFDWWVL